MILAVFKALRSDAYFMYVSDEQRRIRAKSSRPAGSLKMDDFFVTPPRSSIKLHLRRRASNSSNF